MSRERILEGAWSILDEGPLGELTVDAIARSLHMSKSTLYKYFTSKDEVIVGLVDEACGKTRDDARQLGRQLEVRSLDGAVAAVLDLYARLAERLPAAILNDYRSLPPHAQGQLEKVWAELHALCRTAVSCGGRPDEIAAKALSTSARAAMTAAASGEVEAARGAAVRSLQSLFLTGLQTAA